MGPSSFSFYIHQITKMELPKLELVSHNNNLVETLQQQAQNSSYDGLIIVFTDKQALKHVLPSVQKHLDLDASFGESLQLILPDDAQPHKRILLAPTGSLYNDFDDVRRFKDIAYSAGVQALKVGITSPLVCFADEPVAAVESYWTFDANNDYDHFLGVTMLGLLESCFEPIDVRQSGCVKVKTFDRVGVVSSIPQDQQEGLIKLVSAVEAGRRVCKDIGNPDPEIMSPINIAKYIQEQFKDVENVKVSVIDDIEHIKKNYPLAHAVTRASLAVERHHPRFVKFDYVSPDQSKVKEK